jgi:glycosyltransferase involved in cell wall biosynthesis
MSSSSPPSTACAVSVVAPVHDEVDNLAELVAQIHAALEPLELAEGYEIVLVDDASRDGSRELLRELSAADPRCRGLFLEQQSGQSAALLAAIRSARGKTVVTLDSDLQNDPADIPKLLERLDQGFAMVSGVRAKRRDGWLRRVASRIANRFRRAVLGDPFSDSGCALKAYRAELLVDLPAFNGLHRFLPILALDRLEDPKLACELAVNHRSRTAGTSSYGAIRGRLSRGLWDLVGVRWLLARRVTIRLE